MELVRPGEAIGKHNITYLPVGREVYTGTERLC